MSDRKTIAVDLDDTILEYDGYPKFGETKRGAIESLQALRDMGYDIVVYTCRLNGESRDNGELDGQYDELKGLLDQRGIPYDDIATAEDGKILADYYIDDKGVRFEDNWGEIVDFISKKDVNKYAHDGIIVERIVERLINEATS